MQPVHVTSLCTTQVGTTRESVWWVKKLAVTRWFEVDFWLQTLEGVGVRIPGIQTAGRFLCLKMILIKKVNSLIDCQFYGALQLGTWKSFGNLVIWIDRSPYLVTNKFDFRLSESKIQTSYLITEVWDHCNSLLIVKSRTGLVASELLESDSKRFLRILKENQNFRNWAETVYLIADHLWARTAQVLSIGLQALEYPVDSWGGRFLRR